MKKSIFLICDSYPYSYGEFFLDDEIVYLSEVFKNIYVLTSSENNQTNGRFVSTNSQVFNFKSKRNLTFKELRGLVFLFVQFFFIKENISILKNKSKKSYFFHFKIALNEIIRSFKLYCDIIEVVKSQDVILEDLIFYSYWLDYKSLSLVLLKNKFPNTICVSRAHRWEFMDNSIYTYHPFKSYIVNSLNKTYVISEYSKKYLVENYSIDKNKIDIARLGKSNSSGNLVKNRLNKFVICSCSNLIPLKRVDLIIELISKLNLPDILWVHFGDGPEKNKIENLIIEKLSNVNVLLKGAVSNSEIMNFYNSYEVDLFVNLSTIEGVPVSIMEAQSAGIVVLATDVGSTNEIVDAENGFLIPKEFQMEEIVYEIKNYLTSNKESIELKKEKSYKNWLTKYNADINYKKFANDILSL